jgi:exonuclease SbcD
MSRLLCTGDLHAGKRLYKHDRSAELAEVLGEITDLAGRERVDAVLLAGDIFDSRTPSPADERLIYHWLYALAQHHRVVALTGNHDDPERLEALRPFTRGAGVRCITDVHPPDFRPNIVDLGDVCVCAMPWVTERRLLEARDYLSDDRGRDAYSRLMPMVLEAAVDRMSASKPRVLMAHLMIGGAVIGGSERVLTVSETYAVNGGAMPRVDWTVLGHVHIAQNPPATPETTRYVGSPLRHDFSELHPRSVWLIDTESGDSSVIPLVTPYAMHNVHGTLDELRAMEVDERSWVKATVQIPAPEVGIADRVYDAMGERCLAVMTDVPSPPEETPMPSLSTMNVRDLFASYLASKNIDDPPLLDLFDNLLEETA